MKIFIIVLSVFVSMTVYAQAQEPVNDERINSFDVLFTVNTDSSIDVVETIEYDFGEQKRRGIYRDIPYKYKVRGGNFSLQISDISVRTSKSGDVNTKITRPNGNVNIRIGDENVFITGRETYTISYTVSRAINFFESHDELYWNVTGDKWEVPILASSATVRLAQNDGSLISPTKQTCFVGVLGSTERCTLEDGNLSTYTARQLLPGEGFTVVTGFPKDVIRKPTMRDTITLFLSDNLIILLPFVSTLLMSLFWYRRGRDPYVPGTDSIAPQWEIPQFFGRDLRPYEIGIVVDEFSSRNDFSSLFIDLAIRGYYTIEKLEKKWILGKDDYRLTKVKDWSGDETLEDFETIFLDGVFAKTRDVKDIVALYKKMTTLDDGRKLSIKEQLASGEKLAEKMKEELDDPGAYEDQVLISSLRNEFHTKYKNVVASGYKSVLEKEFFEKNPSSVRSVYFFVAVSVSLALAVLFNGIIVGAFGWIGMASIIVSVLVVGVFGLIMPRKTASGVRMRTQILGLKKYLQASEKRPLAMTQSPGVQVPKSPAVFEKYLPYAMVLGVEKQWARQFEGIYDARNASWFLGGSSSDFSAGGMSTMTKGFAAAAGAVAASKPSSSSSGGSGFSGGGSGGGGGGGGGGSW